MPCGGGAEDARLREMLRELPGARDGGHPFLIWRKDPLGVGAGAGHSDGNRLGDTEVARHNVDESQETGHGADGGVRAGDGIYVGDKLDISKYCCDS